ncbi:hypothetical protein HPB52_002816 [Rhipicephalus sanguineus]|uniref:Uncharacterized protein n=1 Tax=Rhipicephalus sanguineus TaxID=34632 RepID=A0A9D4Q9D6_RHISA|nr:hypothetical protein HPB52_002816 [Rhipicephalus sanguineus]
MEDEENDGGTNCDLLDFCSCDRPTVLGSGSVPGRSSYRVHTRVPSTSLGHAPVLVFDLGASPDAIQGASRAVLEPGPRPALFRDPGYVTVLTCCRGRAKVRRKPDCVDFFGPAAAPQDRRPQTTLCYAFSCDRPTVLGSGSVPGRSSYRVHTRVPSTSLGHAPVLVFDLGASPDAIQGASRAVLEPGPRPALFRDPGYVTVLTCCRGRAKVRRKPDCVDFFGPAAAPQDRRPQTNATKWKRSNYNPLNEEPRSRGNGKQDIDKPGMRKKAIDKQGIQEEGIDERGTGTAEIEIKSRQTVCRYHRNDTLDKEKQDIGKDNGNDDDKQSSDL